MFLMLQEGSLIDIPQHNVSVFTSGGEIVRSGGEVQGEDGVGVSAEGVLQSHGIRVPNLDGTIPRGGSENWVLGLWRESNTAYPVGVSVFLDGIFALSDGIPDFNGLIHAS